MLSLKRKALIIFSIAHGKDEHDPEIAEAVHVTSALTAVIRSVVRKKLVF